MQSDTGFPCINQREGKMTENRIIDTKTAADMLGLKPNTLYKWAKYKKSIPYIDYGMSIRFYECDVIEFRKQHYFKKEQ